jgi:hypothetical protein
LTFVVEPAESIHRTQEEAGRTFWHDYLLTHPFARHTVTDEEHLLQERGELQIVTAAYRAEIKSRWSRTLIRLRVVKKEPDQAVNGRANVGDTVLGPGEVTGDLVVPTVWWRQRESRAVFDAAGSGGCQRISQA